MGCDGGRCNRTLNFRLDPPTASRRPRPFSEFVKGKGLNNTDGLHMVYNRPNPGLVQFG